MHLLGGCRLNAFPYKGTMDLAIRNYSQSLFLSWEREIGQEREGEILLRLYTQAKVCPLVPNIQLHPVLTELLHSCIQCGWPIVIGSLTNSYPHS